MRVSARATAGDLWQDRGASAYRSPAVNALGNARYKSCGSNERNAARHIWDRRDRYGFIGAMASIVVPWFADRYAAGVPWQSMAWWIHDHLPYSELQFFPKLAAFNIGWHEHNQGGGSTALSRHVAC